jgi:hypothetical protein
MLDSDAVWYRDLGVLSRRPAEFWPSRDHSPEERLNSLVRLVAYASLAVFLYRRNYKYVAFGMAAVTALSLVHARGGGRRRARGGGARGGDAALTALDGGGGARRGAVGNLKARSVQRRRRACTLSTPDNPFANMLVSDLATNPGRPPACKYDDHADLIAKNFNRGLVRNAYDIYDKENSQRQFMTMPVTTSAPDTVAFAQFCYGNAGRSTCKEDPTRCTGALP